MLTTYFSSRFTLLTAAITILLARSHSFELPFLQTCTIEDEPCHIDKVEKFFQMYGNGIEELDIPTLDPMHLGNITINGNSNENFNLRLYFENMDLFKYPNIKCLSIKGFKKNPTKPINIVLKVFSPQLLVKAHCHVKGKLLLFTVAGETDMNLDLRNVTTTIKTRASTYIKDGLTYLKADDQKPKLQIGSLTTTFANSTLFNGEQIFMETFAETINNNWEVLRDEVEPHINKAVARISLDAINKILPTMPYNKWFKESE